MIWWVFNIYIGSVITDESKGWSCSIGNVCKWVLNTILFANDIALITEHLSGSQNRFDYSRSVHGSSRRRRRVMVEEMASDSSELSPAARPTRRAMSLQEDYLHISTSSVDSRNADDHKTAKKRSSSSRKRKNAMQLLQENLPYEISEGATSDSSVRRSTRSKSKGVDSSTTSSTTKGSPVDGVNSSPEYSTSSRVSHRRNSKNSETPETTRKSLPHPSSNSKIQATVSSRRSSRNSNSK